MYKCAFIISIFTTLFFTSAHAQNGTPYWSTLGNSNATSTSKLGTTNAVNLRLFTGNVERVRITTTGLVGIGTTAPNARLHFDVPSGTSLLRGTVAGSTKLYMSSAGGLTIGAGVAAPANGLYVAGNVGIGTSTPQFLLDVAGRIRLRSGGGATAGLWLNDLANTNAIGFMGVSNDTHIGLWGNTGAGWGLTMNTTTGNVGIGTAPLYPLHVTSATANNAIYAQSTFSGNSDRTGVYGKANNASGYGYGVQGDGGHIGVYGVNLGGSNPAESYGVLGYSSGSAGTRMGVRGYAEGGAKVYGVFGYAANGSFNAAGYFSGNVYANGVLLTSDRKFKQDIQPVKQGLDQVLKLKPSTYLFKTEEYKGMNLPTGKQWGLVADEIKQVFPELVQKAVKPAEYDIKDKTKAISPEVEYEAVNYQGLIPVLVASVQELKAENDALKGELTELREIMQELKNERGGVPTSNSAMLEQNKPNPVLGATTIRYYVPESAASARLEVTNAKGQVVKTIKLNNGSGQVNFSVQILAAGTYNYTLYVDGQSVATKRFVVAR